MRRLLVLAVLCALTAGSALPAAAKAKARPKRVQRVVRASYEPSVTPIGCRAVGEPFACMVVATRWPEAFVAADVRDDHGLPVYVEVRSEGGFHARFCGKPSRPLEFPPNVDLFVYVGLPGWGAQLDCPQHSVKTSGTITVTLSNRSWT